MRDAVSRVIASVVAILLYGWINFLINPVATILSGQVAGKQFENSDISYITSVIGMNFFSNLGIPFVVLLFVLVVIWWKHLKEGYVAIFGAVMICILFGAPQSVEAYFETTNKTEAYTILPNESAFWIPDVGANKDSQVQLDGEAYLNANKVALKRFVVPHVKLTGSGGFLEWDAYVPTGRLIIVDRTAYSQEWVDAHDRGTSKTKQGYPCQSKEGLNLTVGVSIGASVLESNAAKYLYRFGVKSPAGERTDPKVIFTSVYYSRSVKEVMEDYGRKKIQELICDQMSSRGLDQANAEAKLIKDTVVKTATDYFATIGITLEFLGWADTFTFDPDVQKAINDAYAAQKLASVLPVLQALAQLKIQEGMGKGLGDKGLPIVVTPDMINALIGLVKSVPSSAQ